MQLMDSTFSSIVDKRTQIDHTYINYIVYEAPKWDSEIAFPTFARWGEPEKLITSHINALQLVL